MFRYFRSGLPLLVLLLTLGCDNVYVLAENQSGKDLTLTSIFSWGHGDAKPFPAGGSFVAVSSEDSPLVLISSVGVSHATVYYGKHCKGERTLLISAGLQVSCTILRNHAERP